MMLQKIVTGIFFVLLEIGACFFSFIMVSEALEKTQFPFTNNLFEAAIVNAAFYAILALVIIIFLAALNQRLTKEPFNYKLAVPSLILGALVAYFIVDWFHVGGLLKYDDGSLTQLMLVISYAVPIMFFNLGIRMRLNRK
jgi:hypothetical protein